MCLSDVTFTHNNPLCDGFNWPWVVLFSTVDVLAKQSYVKQMIESVWDRSAKRVSLVGRNMQFAINFIISH